MYNKKEPPKSPKPLKKLKKQKEQNNYYKDWDTKTYKELVKISEILIKDIEDTLKKKDNKNWKKIIYNKQEVLLNLKNYIDTKRNIKSGFNLRYPSINHPHFDYLINRKKEFIDYKIIKEDIDFAKKSLKECSDSNFQLTPNQVFLKNYISPSTPYRSLLIYHSMGVGKTCTAITIAEQFKDIIKKFKKKIYVLTPGALTSNFYNGLFDINKFKKDKYIDSYKESYRLKHEKSLKNISKINYTIPQCTGNTYIDGVVNVDELNSLNNSSIMTKIKKNIKKHYSIQGHIQFCNYINNIIEKAIKDIQDEEEILYIRNKKYDEIFSNSIIIVDESHKISETILDEKIKKNKQIGLSNSLSELLMDIAKYSKNLRILLLTATPMIDSPKEIITLLNILLQNDKKPLLPKDDTSLFDNDMLTKDGETILRTVMKGYISYMRSESPGIFPFRINPEKQISFKNLPKKWFNTNQLETIPNENRMKYLNTLLYSYFGKEQFEVYKNQIIEKKNRHNYSIELVQISNISYPLRIKDKLTMDTFKKCFGDEGLKNVFNHNKKKNIYSYKEEFKKNKFLEYKNIENYSCKFKAIFDKIRNSDGIVFIYSQYISGGVTPFALFLEQNGIKRYTYGSDSQLLNNEDIDSESLNYDCYNTESDCKKKKIEFNQAYYVLLTGEQLKKNPTEEAALLKKINSIENNTGKQIKIILGSKVTGEGWDFRCIRQVHILEPWHNLNQTEQTIGRAVRRCSHQSLDFKYRNVEIYLHSALNPLDSEYKDIESVDIRMYRLGELKDIKIAKVKRLCKEVAVDCLLNKVNNLYLEKDWKQFKIDINTSQGKIIKNFDIFDKDYSFICDYLLCNYDCFNKENADLLKKKESEDITTFQFSHSLDKIKFLIEEIKKIYKSGIPYLNYETIKKQLILKNIGFTDILLIKALDDIIKKKILVERDNGEIGHLIYIGTYYVFNKNNNFLPIEYRNTDYLPKQSFIKLNHFLKNNTKSEVIDNIESKSVNEILSEMPIKDKNTDKEHLINCMKYIDRLTINEYRELLHFNILNRKKLKTDYTKILKKVFEKHIIDYKTKKYYFIDNTQKEALKKYYIYNSESQNFDEYQTDEAVSDKIDIPSHKIIGYLDKSKNGFDFKIADLTIDRVRGAVCKQNSKPGAICDFIKRVDKKIFKSFCNSKEKLGKAKLCDILENILRESEIDKSVDSKTRWFFRYYLDIIPPINSK